MPLVKKIETTFSEEEYLEAELLSEVKHEYIGGTVYAMAGASRNHNLIVSNVLSEIRNKLKQQNSPCDIFSSDMKVKESEKMIKYFYPDVLITCDPDDDESEYYVNSPVIIVEVLSESTKKYDLTSKKLYYFNIPSLQEYVVIEQDICRIEVFSKKDNWNSISYFLGDEISLKSIAIAVSVEDIYYHVENKSIDIYLKKKEKERTS